MPLTEEFRCKRSRSKSDDYTGMPRFNRSTQLSSESPAIESDVPGEGSSVSRGVLRVGGIGNAASPVHRESRRSWLRVPSPEVLFFAYRYNETFKTAISQRYLKTRTKIGLPCDSKKNQYWTSVLIPIRSRFVSLRFFSLRSRAKRISPTGTDVQTKTQKPRGKMQRLKIVWKSHAL